MPADDVSRNQSPANPARVATDDVPGPRTPPEDAADYPRTDPGSPPYAEGGPPGATGTGGPDGAGLEATPEAGREPPGPVATGERTYESTAPREPAGEEPAVGVATVPGPDRPGTEPPEPE